jgi:HAD superfamily hydrolase (TIGR01549 family)
VTFDIWHTLIQLDPTAEDRYLERQEALLAEIVRSSPTAPRAPGSPAPVDPLEAAQRSFSAAVERPGRGSPVVGLAHDAARRAGRIPQPERWLAAIEELVGAQSFEAVPGAADQLDRLRRLGYRVGVVSNLVGETGRSIHRVLDRLGLSRSIESWALSEELPWAKPAPEIFWKALEPLATGPADAVHIGDLGADIDGARAAGFRAAVLFEGARRYGPLYARLCHADRPIDPPPLHRLSRWDELPALLPRLFPA